MGRDREAERFFVEDASRRITGDKIAGATRADISFGKAEAVPHTGGAASTSTLVGYLTDAPALARALPPFWLKIDRSMESPIAL
jgi:hypothetical protein